MNGFALVRCRLAATILACCLVGLGCGPALFAAELTRCNGFNDGETAWAAVGGGSEVSWPLRGLNPPVLLPDGTEFRTWEQPRQHRQTYFVAQNSPGAADDNSGTEARPWKTIGRAALALQPGDRVIVKQGVYRECVRPLRGGSDPRRMIAYQAAANETVILSGSERYSGRWQQAAATGDSSGASVWVAELPPAWFGDDNPFAATNLIAGQDNPYWPKDLATRPPYSLVQGLVFQKGRRLVQAATAADLQKAAGMYWVEPGGRRVHVRPWGDEDPTASPFEFTARTFVIAPEKIGLGFIRLSGFSVENVASCFPVPHRGAISTQQGHHWIIEDNVVRQVNSVGLDYGRRLTFLPLAVPADTPALAGVGHIIRRNAFVDCGVTGMLGLGLVGGLVEDNCSKGCGWQCVERLAEAAGLKLLYNKHTLIRRNVVNGTADGPGLWIDHSNANTRVTANIVVGARTRQGGIFVEASYRPNLIDHNIVWDCEGNAFYQHDCSELTVAHNLFGKCTRAPVRMWARPQRILDLETGRRAAAEGNRVIGNVFYGFEGLGSEMPEAGDNRSDYNLFVHDPKSAPFDLVAWQRTTGREAHSAVFASSMSLTTADWTFRQSPVLPSLELPRVPAVQYDFFQTPFPSDKTAEAGPFARKNQKTEIQLRPGDKN